MKFKRFPIKIFLCLWAALPILPKATAMPEMDTESDIMAVRELMRLDTELALRAAKSRLEDIDGSSATTLATGGSEIGQLKLVAIYGVGKRLMAEVLVAGRPYVYMRGQVLPVGVKAGQATYRLAGISGSCVHLELHEDAHTLCLQPSLKVAR